MSDLKTLLSEFDENNETPPGIDESIYWCKKWMEKAFKAGQQDVLGRLEGSGKRYKNEKYSTDSFTISGKKWDKLKQELTDGE